MLEHEDQVVIPESCPQVDVTPSRLLLIVKECVARVHETAADGLLLCCISLNGPCVSDVFRGS